MLTFLGVESGDTIRVPKAGNTGGRNVESGNLLIKLKVLFFFFLAYVSIALYTCFSHYSSLVLVSLFIIVAC